MDGCKPTIRDDAVRFASTPFPHPAVDLLHLLHTAPSAVGHTTAAAAGALVQGADLIVHDSRGIRYIREIARCLASDEAARKLSILPVSSSVHHREGHRKPLVLDHHVVYLALRATEEWFKRAQLVAEELLRLERIVTPQREKIFRLSRAVRLLETMEYLRKREASWLPHFENHWMENE